MKRGRKSTRTYQQLVEIKQRQKKSGKSLFQFATGELKLSMAGYVTLYVQLRRTNLIHVRVRKSKQVKVSFPKDTTVTA